MQRKSKYFLGGAISAGILALTLVTTGSLANVKAQPKVIEMEYDWKDYSTVGELVNDSDLIIVGKVIDDNKSVRNELKIIINEDLPEETKKKYTKDKHYEIVTESQIQISKVVKGDLKPNDVIKVQQTGGTYEDIKQDVKNIKYLKKGNEVLIYLKKTPVSDLYVPINAEQSHNYIENGKIKFNKNDVFIKDKSQTEVSESEIISDIKKNLKE